MNRKKIVIYLNSLKHAGMVGILVGSVIVGTAYVWFHEKGFVAFRYATRELAQEKLRIQRWHSKVASLKAEVAEWQTSPFMSERVARQDLQLIFPDEEIFRYRAPR